MRLRRPFAAGSTLGLLAHNAFETRAGVGLVFEPELGRRGAIALWAASIPMGLARRRPRRASRPSGSPPSTPGIGVAGVAVHFKAWPWSLHGGLPMLDEAEGLSEEQLPAYNAVLWFWGISQRPQPASPRPPAARGASPSPACSTSRSCSPRPTTTSAGRASRRAGTRALEPGAAGRLSSWPGGCRGALSLTFDNLGEAAEIELGAEVARRRARRPPDRDRVAAVAARASSRRASSPRPSSSRA